MLLFRTFPRAICCSVAVALLSVAFLSGCGFRPVHRLTSGQSLQQDLATVGIATIAGRDGLILRNRLLEKISPRGEAQAPSYLLSVQLSSTTDPLLIQLDNSATRNNLKMNAAFTLRDLTLNKTVYQDKANSVASYNVVDSEFATVAAEKNAADRAAREVGEEIFDLLVVYFNGANP